MTIEEWKHIVQEAKADRILIGVHTKNAASFLDKSKQEMTEAIGESANLERNLVSILLYAGGWLLVASIYFAIKAFGWWGLLIFVSSFCGLALVYAYSQLGVQRILTPIAISVSVAIIGAVSGVSVWTKVWLVSVVVSLFLVKLHYYLAHHFIRELVVRNYKAFNILYGNTIFL